MSITAFIFARSGSKRIPNKNIKNFAGKPLIAWTIEKCLSVKKKLKELLFQLDSKNCTNFKILWSRCPFF